MRNRERERLLEEVSTFEDAPRRREEPRDERSSMRPDCRSCGARVHCAEMLFVDSVRIGDPGADHSRYRQ